MTKNLGFQSLRISLVAIPWVVELIGKTGENPAQSHCCIYRVHFLDLKSATGISGKARMYVEV